MHPVMPTEAFRANATSIKDTVASSLPTVELATTMSRVLAYILDIIVVFCIAVVIGIIAALTAQDQNSTDVGTRQSTVSQSSGANESSAESSTTGSFIVIVLLYKIICEKTMGRTLGKKIMGIRVANGRDASRIGWSQSILRNLILIVDAFPFGLIGLIAIERSDLRQRLGDRAAGTVVIKHQPKPSEPRPPQVAYYR